MATTKWGFEIPTLPQARALEVLISTRAHVATGHRTDDLERTISGHVAATLERRGWAKASAILPWAGVIDGADLVKFLGHYTTQYRPTPEGRAAWARWVNHKTGASK